MSDVDEAAREAILQMLRDGRKIEAIKTYREATGSDLTEAKAFIDRLQEAAGDLDPEIASRKQGCGTATGLFLCGLLWWALAG